MMEYVQDLLVAYDGGRHIMTDDQAPVELLGMRVIDGLIANEVDFYREVYDEKGLEGLLEYL